MKKKNKKKKKERRRRSRRRRRRKKEEEEAEEEEEEKKMENCSPVVHVHGWLLSRVEAGRESSIDLSEAFLTADCREIAWLSVWDVGWDDLAVFMAC